MASEIDEIRARFRNAKAARRNEGFGMDDAQTLLAAFDAANARAEKAERERDEARADAEAKREEWDACEADLVGRNDSLRAALELASRDHAVLEAQLTRAKAEGAREALRRASREFRRHGLGAEPPAEICGEDDSRREAWDDAADWCDREAARLAGEEPKS